MAALTPENTGGSFKSFFGRLCGLLGDDLGFRHLWIGGANGKVVASTRLDVVTVVTGLNGAGGITLASVASGNANVGDLVISVLQLDGTPADASASFEAAITVAGQIQQTSASNLSSHTYLVTVKRQS